MDITSKFALNNGVKMPLLGLGVFRSPMGETTRAAVRTALEYCYRHIDTARVYCNEKSVGRAIAEYKSVISRDELFVTTKLWKDDFKNPRQGLIDSLTRLNLDYVDLYLLHWPFEGYEQAWLELEKLQKEGLCRAIGVSNFKIHHLERLKECSASVVPQVNQVECHPANAENELLSYCKKNQICLEAYSPLGGEGRTLVNDPRIMGLADYYKVTPAQIILRWNIQRGVPVIPKSIKPQRILENSKLFDFEIKVDDMATIDEMNMNARRAFDSDRINQRPLESFPTLVEEP
ncbi:2,5-diketo-D-gluconic acid reductase A [Anaerobiospirillum thomasii]|uniref:2,5-diketo-D-gluconic acid reductase A n=1 Tax=Anaerobiospirillum thomasii TaxID=179995 RepID=A0A2X0VAV0_9GAMM|nr:aldo/keto reductase [Anaerobiospirillum thomasii]SPT67791.1 2,5-diketo-D-gluconic acid reductase A [Anaerobiospirillum thomasii]SPT70246.1 2,5-diketo-D-gluconic acid reductase A [Anaerobiospirillum thomasii]